MASVIAPMMAAPVDRFDIRGGGHGDRHLKMVRSPWITSKPAAECRNGCPQAPAARAGCVGVGDEADHAWLSEKHSAIAGRRGRNVATIAVARKLLTLVYYVLRDGHIRAPQARTVPA
jgi:hypothetical protein